MPYTQSGKHAMLDHLRTLVTQVSLHTADPGATGAGEVTGGAYSRQAITWSAASGGAIGSSNQAVFNVPAGTTVTHVGFWAGTTLEATAAVTAETFAAAGTYTLSSASLDLNA